jgi:predicted O-methyltransferase YrrM
MASLKSFRNAFLRKLFEVGQRFGLDILPRHYYSPTPDIRALKADQNWRKPFEMAGVLGADVDAQANFLHQICPPAQRDTWIARKVYEQANDENGQGGGYGHIEACVLYGFIQAKRPAKIVQIGCGVSTSVMLRAARDAGYKPQLTCIEPYPSRFLLDAAARGDIRLIAEKAQDVDIAHLTGLGAGDLLFVDSTHTVKAGSEVNRIILDIMPRLKSGVLVHFHDIYFPYDYTRGLLGDDLFFNVESTLLHAFLACNSNVRILVSLSMLHYARVEAISNAMAHYRPQINDQGLRTGIGEHFPSATYLEYIG